TQHDGNFRRLWARRPSPARSFCFLQAWNSSLILDRLALGPHVCNHRPENPHPDTWRDFEFELRVVHYSRHFADQASGRDHAIAPARILDEIGMFLLLFALWPDDKKIRDGKDQREGHQLH